MRRCLPEIHQSEWDWIGSTPDWVIENDGSLADLKSKVDDMITHYFPKWSK
jgi:dephospho-CoA kinase